MTRQASDNLYIELGYLTPEEYYTYEANAALSSSAESNLTATVGVIKQSASTMVVTATVAATISHIEGADMFAFTNAALALTVTLIRDNNVAVSDVFDIATDYRRYRDISADELAEFTVDAINERGREFNIETQAAFSLATENERIRGLEVNAVGQANLTSQLDITKNFYSAYIGEFFVYCDATEITPQGEVVEAYGAWTSTSSILASIDGLLEASSTQNSQFALSAVISNVRGVDIVVTDFAQLSSSVDAIRGFDSTQSAEFSQTTANERIRDFALTTTSEFALNADFDGIVKYASVDFTSDFALVATITNVRGVDIVVSDFANLTVEAAVFREVAAALSAETSQTLINDRIRDNAVAANSEFTQALSADRIRDLNADNTSEFTLTATISHIEGADIVISDFAAMTVNAVKSVSAAAGFNVVSSQSCLISATKKSSAALSNIVSTSISVNRLPYAIVWDNPNLTINNGRFNLTTSGYTAVSYILNPNNVNNFLTLPNWTIDLKISESATTQANEIKSLFRSLDDKFKIEVWPSTSAETNLIKVMLTTSTQQYVLTKECSITQRFISVVKNGNLFYAFDAEQRIGFVTISGTITNTQNYFSIGSGFFPNHICSIHQLKFSNIARYPNNTTRSDGPFSWTDLRYDTNTVSLYNVES